MLPTTVTFTTTINSSTIEWVREYAQNHNISQRSVLENALSMYRDEIKRKEMEEGFKRASKDKEMTDLADAGLDDYLKQIEAY